MKLSRVNWREQRRWWSKTMCARQGSAGNGTSLPLYWSTKRASRSASRSAIILTSISWRSLLSSSSWACNIPIQCYNNSKRRYISQGMMSYRSTNLELLYAMMWVVLPRSYGWARARASCSHLRQSGSGRRVDCPIGHSVPSIPLASSDPHEDISVDVLGPRIVIWPMDLMFHGSVLT
jgi:hypothetical protein